MFFCSMAVLLACVSHDAWVNSDDDDSYIRWAIASQRHLLCGIAPWFRNSLCKSWPFGGGSFSFGKSVALAGRVGDVANDAASLGRTLEL